MTLGRTLLFDTTAAIAFIEELGRPDLIRELTQLGHDVELVSKVVDELLEESTKYTILSMDGVEMIKHEHYLQYVQLSSRYPMLGQGELAVMARSLDLKHEGREFTCILDDGKARQVAKSLDLPLSGTVGILKYLESNGVLLKGGASKLTSILVAEGFRFKMSKH